MYISSSSEKKNLKSHTIMEGILSLQSFTFILDHFSQYIDHLKSTWQFCCYQY